MSKWHFVGAVVVLYAIIVGLAMATHQSQETMAMLLQKGAPGVGGLVLAVLWFAD